VSVIRFSETTANFDEQAMPFDERIAQRVRDILAEECPAKERGMFGGLALVVNGHMCCGIVGEDLVVRVGAERHEQALSQPHARAMDFTGRPMTGFVYVGLVALAQRRLSRPGSSAVCILSCRCHQNEHLACHRDSRPGEL